MNNIIESLEKKANWFLLGKNWILKCTFLCFLIVLFFSCPLLKDIHYHKQLIANGDSNCWHIFNLQKETPFNQNVYDSFHPSSHQSKLAFKFTMPLIAKIFHLTSVHVYLIQVILGIIQFLLLGLLVFNRFNDKTIAFLLMVSYCFIYCGYMSFTQFVGIFDGISIFFILFALYFKNNILSVLPLLIAYFNDERSILACIVIAVIFYFNPSKIIKNKSFLIIFTSIFLYTIIRFLLQYYLNLNTPSGENSGFNLKVFNYNFGGMANMGKGFQLEFMLALEGFWIIYLIFIYQKYKESIFIQLSLFWV